MDINVAKEKVQSEALVALAENNGGIVAIATGGGKSKIGIDFMKMSELVKKTKLDSIIVVPTEKLRDKDWGNEFDKWSTEEHYNRVEKYCYASVNKIKGKHYDIVILDEVQFITENNAEFFKNNTVGTVIALTATPPDENIKKEILRKLGLKIVYHVSIDEAVDKGIIAPFKIIMIEMELNDTNRYIKAGNKKISFMTTEKKQYDYLSKRIEDKKNNDSSFSSLKFLYLERMRFIYNLLTKRNVAKYILDNVIPEDERTLIFTGSIAVAEELESNSYHSKSNDVAFNKFVNGEINRLSCVKSLNVGVNIPNLDNALIVQVDSKERNLIQRMGRIVRFRPDHIANIYIMYVKDTVDEQWVKNATRNVDTSQVSTIKVRIS